MRRQSFLFLVFTFFFFPSLVWAGFFSKDPVTKVLDKYEFDREVARQQITAPPKNSPSNFFEPVKPVPAEAPSASTGKKVHELVMGIESYSYRYEETVGGERFMRLKGVFYGVFLAGTFRPNQLAPTYSDLVNVLRLDARFAWARLDYDGGVQDLAGNIIAPLSLEDIPDYVFETRFLLEKEISWNGLVVTPFSGLGFRYLHDDSSDTTGTFNYLGDEYSINGYKRVSQYYYVPFGVDVSRALANDWLVGFSAEYDHLIYGKQKSYIESIDNSVPENDQPEGYGLRASVRLEKLSPRLGLSVEPFWRYWDIEDSEINDGIQEPSNTTSEVGVKVGMTF